MKSGYGKLAIAISINAVIMYFLTYVNLATLGHFHFNINRVYMAVIMAAPMVIVMLLVMSGMFPNPRLNAVLYLASAGVFILVFLATRNQVPVGNEQFLRSMIPHHSSAILMCQRSAITDPETIELCHQIIKSQREEIAQMEDILLRLNKAQ